MGKTTPPPQAQEVRQTSSNLPEYARPYFENVTSPAHRWLHSGAGAGPAEHPRHGCS
jgi:hypothetical protein